MIKETDEVNDGNRKKDIGRKESNIDRRRDHEKIVIGIERGREEKSFFFNRD